jgi:Photosynthetic reaction centre cytochrome C subunit
MIKKKQALAGSAMSLTVASMAFAQQWSPSPPTNLKVLASTTTVRELLPVMKGFTQGLGVRCQHCHVYRGENPDDLSAFDFASDEKTAKASARSMMRMVRVVNEDLLKGVGEPTAAGDPKVTCYTCHRGEKRPLNKRPNS